MTTETEAVAVALVDTETATVIAGNRAFAELVGHAAESLAGLPVATYLDQPRADGARAVLAQMRDGWVEFLEGEVELRRPNGPVHAYSWSLVLGGQPPRRKVIVGAVPISRRPGHDHASRPPDPNRTVLGTLDHDGRFQDLATRSATMLGWPAEREGAARLHEIVHPADEGTLATLLNTTAVALGPTTAELRLRGRDEGWLDASVTVSRFYGLASAPLVSVIGFVAPPVVTFTELTERQNEIVRRLVGGQQVAAIARDLFVSPSTVRNHLSAIYKAFGVKTQSELIRHILTQGPTGRREP
ncbi:MAG: hypothetical protein QOI61_817 [Actinomycetota bacterium]